MTTVEKDETEDCPEIIGGGEELENESDLVGSNRRPELYLELIESPLYENRSWSTSC